MDTDISRINVTTTVDVLNDDGSVRVSLTTRSNSPCGNPAFVVSVTREASDINTADLAALLATRYGPADQAVTDVRL